MLSIGVVVLFALGTNFIFAYPADHKVTNLPGLTFNPGFDQYAGYLNASTSRYQHYLFYWLILSQGDPSNDPIVLWLNGGPGCSSLGGFMTELGPFHPNKDGATLYENVYAWNKKVNMLFVEAPTGVGFSYSTDWNDNTSDDQTADDNYRALQDFFANKFPEFKSRDFYITGESYCGVYIPTLTQRLVGGMKPGGTDFPNNLKGIAIGNGILSEHLQHNAVIMYMYYHGLIGNRLWNRLNIACCNSPDTTCDWYSKLIQLNNDWISDGTLCGNLTYEISEQLLWHTRNDAYNIYQDCYTDGNLKTEKLQRLHIDFKLALGQMSKQKQTDFMINPNPNNAMNINYDSTDQLNGFPCWGGDATTTYLNRQDVRQALHIDPFVINKQWADCNGTVGQLYRRTYYEMDDVFKYIVKNSTIRILIYNGDVDMVCNFLGDEWFIFNVTAANDLQNIGERGPWRYRSEIAGYVQKFNRIDLVTVKGAGHFVPSSRSGPALQMIMNFVWNKDYSTPTGISTNLKPLISATTTTKTGGCNSGKIASIFIVLSAILCYKFIV